MSGDPGAFDYDLFVIGGGSGGVRAARWSAMAGAKVALAEADRYGGTCVIRGCVPKKLMVFASAFSEAVQDARGFHWEIEEPRFDWPAFIAKKDKEIDRLETVYEKNLQATGVTTFRARATLTDPHSVALSTGERIRAKHILIATGGRPYLPKKPGIEHAISSDEIFHLPALPRRTLIIGGGYIACEFACILNGMGSETTQFYRGAQILRGFDEEVRGHVAEEMRKKGVDLHVGRDLVRIDKTPEGLLVKCSDGTEAVFDTVLAATGRVPNTEGLGLDALGIGLAENGAVEVDRFSQTKLPSVYAIGDVTDRVNLTPVAIREGMAFAETVFKANPTPVDHETIPTAVFTQPEVGTVGLTEEEARARHRILIYRTTFRPMFHAFAGRQERTLMKLVVDKESRRVLGVHIVGPSAGEMIQMVGIAVKMGATKEDFDRTVAVHPTSAEEMVTMREAIDAEP